MRISAGCRSQTRRAPPPAPVHLFSFEGQVAQRLRSLAQSVQQVGALQRPAAPAACQAWRRCNTTRARMPCRAPWAPQCQQRWLWCTGRCSSSSCRRQSCGRRLERTRRCCWQPWAAWTWAAGAWRAPRSLAAARWDAVHGRAPPSSACCWRRQMKTWRMLISTTWTAQARRQAQDPATAPPQAARQPLREAACLQGWPRLRWRRSCWTCWESPPTCGRSLRQAVLPATLAASSHRAPALDSVLARPLPLPQKLAQQLDSAALEACLLEARAAPAEELPNGKRRTVGGEFLKRAKQRIAEQRQAG